jgi:Ca-activated chloride channel family protein
MHQVNSGFRLQVRIHNGVLAAALLLLARPSLAPAQNQAAAQNQDDEAAVAVFRSGTELVDLPISVLDKNGKLIPDIPQSAFKVYENNIEQPILSFRRDDIPVSIGIIIDNSASMRDKRSKVAAAALALVTNSNPQDEEFIVDFDDDAYLDQPFTSDIEKLKTTLARINSHGGTAMREAISSSIDYMNQAATRTKKVLLVVTDGNDNNPGGIGLEALLRKAQASEVLIYCIGLLNEEEPSEARAARRALKELAEASGGQEYYPKDLAEVEQITPQVAHEIRNQYLLAYRPTNPALDGTYRKITVRVTGYEKATVRTRSGYYASSDASKRTGASSFK